MKPETTLSELTDDEIMAEVERRGLEPEVADLPRDDERDTLSTQDVERLAEHIAAGEIDDALSLLSQLCPRDLPYPYLVRQRIAIRRGEPTTGRFL